MSRLVLSQIRDFTVTRTLYFQVLSKFHNELNIQTVILLIFPQANPLEHNRDSGNYFQSSCNVSTIATRHQYWDQHEQLPKK
jgi:hypothetical protein